MRRNAAAIFSGGTSLVPLERAAHVIDVSARDGDAVPVHVLRELQCHVLDADLQREIAQSRVTLCSAEPEHVIQLLWQLHGAQLGGKVTALSSEHKRDLRRYFVRTIKRQWHVTSQQHVILKQLAIFELVGAKNSERFVSLSQYTSRAPGTYHCLIRSSQLTLACSAVSRARCRAAADRLRQGRDRCVARLFLAN